MAECGSITLSGYIFSLNFEHIERLGSVRLSLGKEISSRCRMCE